MSNLCQFSPCRKYRYSLLHSWDELFERRRCIFICLNPSTADETQLDPTLTRIRAFSQRLGCNEFLMLNIFAFRATDPKNMKSALDPVGPENDAIIRAHIEEAAELNSPQAIHVVAGWGTQGDFLNRDAAVLKYMQPLIERLGGRLTCLGQNANGSPKHPLYIKGTAEFLEYPRTIQ